MPSLDGHFALRAEQPALITAQLRGRAPCTTNIPTRRRCCLRSLVKRRSRESWVRQPTRESESQLRRIPGGCRLSRYATRCNACLSSGVLCMAVWLVRTNRRFAHSCTCQLTAALDMTRTHEALQHLKRDPRQFRDAVRTLLRPAEMLLTVLATSAATKASLLQQIRPLIVAAASLYYCEGTAADDVLRHSTLCAQQGGDWDRACTMADLMDKPVQVLRTVDMLIVALAKHLDRCDLAGLTLRLEYGTMLVRARALCWIACLPPHTTSAAASYRPMVQWLHDWGQRAFAGAAQRHGLRLDIELVQNLTDAAAGHPQLAANIHAVLKTHAGV